MHKNIKNFKKNEHENILKTFEYITYVFLVISRNSILKFLIYCYISLNDLFFINTKHVSASVIARMFRRTALPASNNACYTISFKSYRLGVFMIL